MRTRLGFIGAGYIAGVHLESLLAFEDADVAAVADPDAERAASFAARSGGRAYRTAAEMLDRECLDAVYICVPPFAHGAPELAATERGIPFFVEKPLSADLPTAEEIAERVATLPLVTATGYHWRYLDTTEEARELLAGNPARLALGHWFDVLPPPPWWATEALSGGQTVEQLTHIIDLARLLVGEVTRVYAAGARTGCIVAPEADICDVSAAMLHFDSGALGTLAATCLLTWRDTIGLRLVAEGMTIELTETTITVNTGQEAPTRSARLNAFAREDRDFLDAVQGKRNQIRAPYDEALRSHRLAIAVARSAREERIIDLRTGASSA
jgi:predicted dehydrogenase